MKKGLLLLSIVFMVQLASAEILVSQPGLVYNLGDKLDFQVTLQPEAKTSGFALISIKCSKDITEVYRSPVSVSEGESKSLDVSVPLNSVIIGNNRGDCTISASYGGESVESSSFRISDKIDVQANFNDVQYSPGDSVKIKGKALKENGNPVEGFVKARIYNMTFTFPISAGNIEYNFSLPGNTAPGEVDAVIEVYDKDSSGSVENSGLVIKKMRVKQIIKSLNIQLYDLEVTPESSFSYKIDALDQVNSESKKEIVLNVLRPNGEIYITKTIYSGNTEYLSFPLNVEAGIWTIKATLGGLTESKTFIMPEIEKADFEFVNDTLVVKNAGNVPYLKSIKVTIGNKTITKDISLNIDGSKLFKLLAPAAEYFVEVNDGETKARALSIPLTGRAIDIGEVKSFSGSIIPAMIILIIIIGLYIYLKIRKLRKMSYGGHLGEYTPKTPLVKAAVSQDASIEEGVRETGAIVALRLPEDMPSAFRNTVPDLRQKATARKAHSEARGGYMLFLLTERLSGQDYEMEAIKLAQEIQRTIKSALSSSNMRVPYSIGISKGEVITSGSLGRLFSFTALGNSVSKAQKLASQAHGEIVVSDAIKSRVGAQAKFSKLHGIDAWKVESVVNRDEHSGFISSFVKRQGKK